MDTDPAELDQQLREIDWAALLPGMTKSRVDAPSGSLAWIGIGPEDGPRVVLVPGVTGSKEDFLLMMPLLAAAGYRVESFDMAGQFESGSAGPEHLDPPATHYTLELFVDDLIAVLERGAAPAHLLGYSFAGTVAAAATIRRPDLVATLTLLSTPPMSGRVFGGIRHVGWLTGRAGPRAAAAVMLAGIRCNVTRVGRSRMAFVRSRFALARRSSVSDVMRIMSRTPDLATELRATGVPTLVAAGTSDLWPMTKHRQFAAACCARFAAYPTGHSPCETTPHQLTADLLRLFAAAEGQAADGSARR